MGLRGQGRAGGPGRDHRLRRQLPRPHASASSASRPTRDARGGFGPFAPGFRIVPFGDADALEAAITPNTVGLPGRADPGRGGRDHPAGRLLRSACASSAPQHNVTLILDEIQTGLGRTGKLLAEEHEGIEADVTLIGKALSGGFYPVSAVLSNSEVLGVLQPGQHGSTFGGNPLACAVARAALKVLTEEGMIENAGRAGRAISRPACAAIRSNVRARRSAAAA